MSGSLVGLLYLQVLYLAIGAGLLQLLGLRGWRRLGLAYLAGLAVVGLLAAELVLVQITLGLVELTLLALVTGVTAFLRRPRRVAREDRKRTLLGLAPLAPLVALLGYALVAVGRRPLLEFDGWAIWGMKARALYQLGGTANPVFTSDAYPPLQHPLL